MKNTGTLKNCATFLNGAKVEILRQSDATGSYSVRLTEDLPNAPAYVSGTRISVAGYQLERDK